MTTSDPDKKPQPYRLLRFIAKPKMGFTSDARRNLGAFLFTAGNILLYYAVLSIEGVHEAKDAILSLLRTVKIRFRIDVDVGHDATSAATSASTHPDSDQTTRTRERIQAALQRVAQSIDAIRQKGGAVGFSKASLRRQLKQAPYEFPEDEELAELTRKIGYTEIKSTEDLPSPPETALKIMELTKDLNVDNKRLVDVIKSDPAIAARLLKYANSSFVGMRKHTDSIERAVLHLGHSPLRTIVLAFSLVSANRKGSCSAFAYSKFWTECAARAAAARQLAGCCRLGIAPEDAFAAGLLCQVGRLALATALPDQYANVLGRTNLAIPRRLSKLERQEFGIDHRELAAEMMADWGMSRFFWQAILFQADLPNEQILPLGSRERALAMILSWTETIWIAMTAKEIPLEEGLQEAVISQAEELGIARERFPEAFDETVKEWCELGTILEVATPTVPPWDELAG